MLSKNGVVFPLCICTFICFWDAVNVYTCLTQGQVIFSLLLSLEGDGLDLCICVYFAMSMPVVVVPLVEHFDDNHFEIRMSSGTAHPVD